MSVQALWDSPERAREDAAFERSRTQRRSNDPEVFVVDDENVDRIMAGRLPLLVGAPSGPVTTGAKSKATSTASRAPGSGANRSGSPGSGRRTGRDGPTRSWPPNPSIPMPAPVQAPAHRRPESRQPEDRQQENRRPENTAPPDPEDIIVVPEDNGPLTGAKGKAKRQWEEEPGLYTRREGCY